MIRSIFNYYRLKNILKEKKIRISEEVLIYLSEEILKKLELADLEAKKKKRLIIKKRDIEKVLDKKD